MIPANELRIGNWVKVGDIESTVCLIDHNSFIQLLGNAIVNRPEQIEPIPLTPEIFERFGFIKNPYEAQIYIKDKNNGYKGNLKLHFSKKNGTTVLKNSGGTFIRIVTLRYLHQLQNLWFGFTGEELTKQQARRVFDKELVKEPGNRVYRNYASMMENLR